MKSVVVKRTVDVAGHKTSISLEHAFWQELKEVAAWRDMSLTDLLDSIDSERRDEDLSSAIRLVVLNFYRHQLLQRIISCAPSLPSRTLLRELHPQTGERRSLCRISVICARRDRVGSH